MSRASSVPARLAISPTGPHGAPHLFGQERGFFDAVLDSGHSAYLEFGMGGSTTCAVVAGFDAIVAVDSDPSWIDAIRRTPEVAAAVASGVASLLHADIGPVGPWGMPVSTAHRDRWPVYLSIAWSEWARRGRLPDLVYVDGRFRVACCLSALIACAQDATARNRLRVLMHDFDERRPQYRPVLEHFQFVAGEGSLVLLRARPSAGGGATLAALMTHLSHPD